MKTSDIIEIIYKYYPRVGAHIAYGDSTEYLNRVEKCNQARLNQIEWLKFKEEFTVYTLSQYNDDLADYSILGNAPCYSASIGFGKFGNKNSWMLSVLISVIIPLWSYRIIDFDAPNSVRYEASHSHEKQTIQFLEFLIKKHFPDYRLIEEQQSQIIIPDISTAFKTSPTIFEAIFKEDLN